jgi:hypothetical protein
MERRNFLRAMLGVAAATALPSEVWPFRKIFLPMTPTVWSYEEFQEWLGLSKAAYPGALNEAAIQAIELEVFAKQIPDLFCRDRSLYKMFAKHGTVLSNPTLRVPIRAWHSQSGIFT